GGAGANGRRETNAHGVGPAVPRRVARRDQQRGALEVIRRREANLRVDVRPVGWERGERILPLLCERSVPGRWGNRCGFRRTDDLQVAPDSLLVDSPEPSADRPRWPPAPPTGRPRT